MNKQIVFSVIVPVYKVEPYLKKCVESVLKQDFDDYELILVDDGSPDACPIICDNFEKENKKVRVVHKKNGGLVSARNAGIAVSRGEYIISLDGDDWFAHGTLRSIWERAIKNYNPDMIIFNMTRVYNDREEKDPCFVDEGYYGRTDLEKKILPYMMYDSRKGFYHGLLFPSAGGKVIKRTILEKHFCQEERIRMGEDNAFIFECLYSADSAFFLSEYYYMYNQMNSGSIRSNYDCKRFENNNYLINYISNRLAGKEDYIDTQLNVFKAYWLIMAIFHEVKCKRPILKSANHIRTEIEKYNSLSGIDYKALPKEAKMYIGLIEKKMYVLALIGANGIEILRHIKKSI